MTTETIELTDEQRAKCAEYVEKWTSIGLSTDPCDREYIERVAVPGMYKAVGLSPPASVIWFDSPFTMCAKGSDLDGSGADTYVMKNAEECIVANMPGLVSNEHMDPVNSSKYGQVWVTLKATVRERVWVRVGFAVWLKLMRVLHRNPPRRRKTRFHMYGGQFAADLVSFHSFLEEQLGVKLDAATTKGAAMVQTGGYIPYKNTILISERPRHIRMNSAGHLHSADSCAVEYRDGLGIYRWNGVDVPEVWIKEKDKIDPRRVLATSNIERRRVLCEILGWEKILKACNVKEIQHDEFGALLEVDEPALMGAPAKFVKVTCPSTGRTYILATFADVQTAHEAVARSFGSTPEEYRPRIET